MIISCNGNLGAGKTHTAIEITCEMANRLDKVIVTNIQLDLAGMLSYCLRKGYRKLAARIARGEIFYTRNVKKMLGYKNAVVLLDEAGVFLSRKMMVGRLYLEFQPLIADLLQSRKGGTDLVWIAQVHEDVAEEIRNVTNEYYHIANVLGFWKFRTCFGGWGYREWLKMRTFQKWWKHNLGWKFYEFDASLFAWYGTLDRLDGKKIEDPLVIKRDASEALGLHTFQDSHMEVYTDLIEVGKGENRRMVPSLALRPSSLLVRQQLTPGGMFCLPDAFDGDKIQAKEPPQRSTRNKPRRTIASEVTQ